MALITRGVLINPRESQHLPEELMITSTFPGDTRHADTSTWNAVDAVMENLIRLVES